MYNLISNVVTLNLKLLHNFGVALVAPTVLSYLPLAAQCHSSKGDGLQQPGLGSSNYVGNCSRLQKVFTDIWNVKPNVWMCNIIFFSSSSSSALPLKWETTLHILRSPTTSVNSCSDILACHNTRFSKSSLLVFHYLFFFKSLYLSHLTSNKLACILLQIYWRKEWCLRYKFLKTRMKLLLCKLFLKCSLVCTEVFFVNKYL